MELFAFFAQLVINSPLNALGTPRHPFFQYLTNAHNPGIAADEYIEVAGELILQCGELEKLLHKLLRICAAFKVDCKLQTAQIGLVAHIAYLTDLPRFQKLGNLIHYLLNGGGIGYFIYLYHIFLWQIAPAGAYFEASASRTIDILHFRETIDYLAACRKIRGGHSGEDVVTGIGYEVGGGLTDFSQIEAADLACHTDGNAHIGGNKDVGEAGGQQGGLKHCAVIVVHKIDGVLIDILEYLGADGGQLGFGITGGCISHIP